ncbi:response regulator [Muriicola sp. Z0-33]|uniref:response regulator n=1 Tax=Muriicola sp. Z0-33 TaxID=2816957 RepID=UPI0022371BF6|nr:response regulator [Muriicola sp. Z0-33]MCW5515775.1 response regulator [Muriicola sp. Z0-33]
MKKVLLIEDDVSLRENTAELLELSGYEVLMASNGKVGVTHAKTEMPDVIVCDIMMPEMDGYAVLKELSVDDKTKFIPFIFLSAKTERADVRMGMDLGADDYLTKPFEEEELLSAIQSRLARTELLSRMAASTSKDIPEVEDQMSTLNELKNFFDDYGAIENFSKGVEIFREGDRSNTIYLILKGVVKCNKMDEDGKELITSLNKADEFLGFTSFADNTLHRETATAVEDTEVAGISKSQLKDILQNNQNVSIELMELLTDNITDIKEQLLQMAYSSVRKKTAQTLLQFSEILNKDPKGPIRISRSDLANVAGIATESLIRTLSGFKREGLIDIEGRNIRITDLDALEHVV